MSFAIAAGLLCGGLWAMAACGNGAQAAANRSHAAGTEDDETTTSQSLWHAREAVQRAWSRGLSGVARRGVGWLSRVSRGGRAKPGQGTGAATGCRTIRE